MRAAGSSALACPRWVGGWLVLVALCLFLDPFARTPTIGQGLPGASQFRAYWVDSFGPGLYSEAQITQLVADAHAAHLNAIIAQVTRRADCLCNRSIMPRTEAGIDPEPFDPLQTLIDKAHAAGIEVHAWINAGIMWAPDVPPRDPVHIFSTHGPAAQENERWITRRYDGAIRGGTLYFFDPGHPDAAEYIVNMALSIVRNYDVDGINLDYIRYPDFNPAEGVPGWGYNPVALARFQALTGRTDVPAATDPEWMDWRREQITSIVRKIYIEAYAIRPPVRLSADTITYGDIAETEEAWIQSRPYREVLQDWRSWMAEGILDLNIPMNYRRRTSAPAGQRAMFDIWNGFIMDHQYDRQAAIGTALYLNTVADSVAQIRTAITPNANGRSAVGWVGFSYRTPDSFVNQGIRPAEAARAELTQALTASPAFDVLRESELDADRGPVFPTPIPVPPMPWKLAPTGGAVRGSVTMHDGAPADQVWVRLRGADGALTASRLTTGTGWIGFIDLPPGTYTLAATGPTGEVTTAAVTVTAGRVSTASFALRR
jgi:uncharacterized lipoprotein YddW (UPF0748 family)